MVENQKLNRIAALYARREFSLAEQALSSALSERPKEKYLLYYKSAIENRKGNYATADRILGSLLKEYPDDPWILHAFSEHRLANARGERLPTVQAHHELDVAEHALRRALTIAPNLLANVYMLADCLLEKGELNEAWKLIGSSEPWASPDPWVARQGTLLVGQVKLQRERSASAAEYVLEQIIPKLLQNSGYMVKTYTLAADALQMKGRPSDAGQMLAIAADLAAGRSLSKRSHLDQATSILINLLN